MESFREFGGNVHSLAADTVKVWWRLLPKLITISVIGWLCYEILIRIGAAIAPLQSFVALFMVSVGFLCLLAAIIACLTMLGRELHVEEIVPTATLHQPLSTQMAVTILPFLGIYAVFNYVERAANALVGNALYLHGLSADGLTDTLNPFASTSNAWSLVIVVVGAYVVRRVFDVLQERTGARIFGFGAALIEGFFMLLLILTGMRLIEWMLVWFMSLRVYQWLTLPYDGLVAIGRVIAIDVPEIFSVTWSFLADRVWPALLWTVGEPLLWLAVAALVYGSGVISLAELWRKGRPLHSSVPLTRHQKRKAQLAEARHADSSGRGRRIGLEIAEAFFGDVDDKYLPTFQSLSLVVRTGTAFMAAYLLLYTGLNISLDLVEWLFEAIFGGLDLGLWVGLHSLLGLIKAAVFEPLRLSLLAVTFHHAMVVFRTKASGRQPEAPSQGVRSVVMK